MFSHMTRFGYVDVEILQNIGLNIIQRNKHQSNVKNEQKSFKKALQSLVILNDRYNL
jgi:hypothetical protein